MNESMNPMRIRLAGPDDLEAIFDLATQAGPGMTTLKPNRDQLAARLHTARESVQGRLPMAMQDYVFVLEETNGGKVVGLSAIKAAIGLDQPFYSFRIGTLVHSSEELRVLKKYETMYLSNDMTGAAELCSLFLLPEYRTGQCGRLLSKCRLLFLTLFPDRFPSRVMAEMRGYQRDDGVVPFWDDFARQFFDIDFGTADALTNEGKKSFISELMPRYPIYTNLLPQSVRDVIGKVHPHTAPARRLLEQEGLAYSGYIDIFDGGPQLHVGVAQLRMNRELQRLPVALSESRGRENLLVATAGLPAFSAIVCHGEIRDGHICLGREEMEALGVDEGQQVAVVPLHPAAHKFP